MQLKLIHVESSFHVIPLPYMKGVSIYYLLAFKFMSDYLYFPNNLRGMSLIGLCSKL